jgi:hypothetical protein
MCAWVGVCEYMCPPPSSSLLHLRVTQTRRCCAVRVAECGQSAEVPVNITSFIPDVTLFSYTGLTLLNGSPGG